jgi:hypothetical protein
MSTPEQFFQGQYAQSQIDASPSINPFVSRPFVAEKNTLTVQQQPISSGPSIITSFSSDIPVTEYRQGLGETLKQSAGNIFNFGVIGQQGVGPYFEQITQPFEYYFSPRISGAGGSALSNLQIKELQKYYEGGGKDIPQFPKEIISSFEPGIGAGEFIRRSKEKISEPFNIQADTIYANLDKQIQSGAMSVEEANKQLASSLADLNKQYGSSQTKLGLIETPQARASELAAGIETLGAVAAFEFGGGIYGAGIGTVAGATSFGYSGINFEKSILAPEGKFQNVAMGGLNLAIGLGELNLEANTLRAQYLRAEVEASINAPTKTSFGQRLFESPERSLDIYGSYRKLGTGAELINTDLVISSKTSQADIFRSEVGRLAIFQTSELGTGKNILITSKQFGASMTKIFPEINTNYFYSFEKGGTPVNLESYPSLSLGYFKNEYSGFFLGNKDYSVVMDLGKATNKAKPFKSGAFTKEFEGGLQVSVSGEPFNIITARGTTTFEIPKPVTNLNVLKLTSRETETLTFFTKQHGLRPSSNLGEDLGKSLSNFTTKPKGMNWQDIVQKSRPVSFTPTDSLGFKGFSTPKNLYSEIGYTSNIFLKEVSSQRSLFYPIISQKKSSFNTSLNIQKSYPVFTPITKNIPILRPVSFTPSINKVVQSPIEQLKPVQLSAQRTITPFPFVPASAFSFGGSFGFSSGGMPEFKFPKLEYSGKKRKKVKGKKLKVTYRPSFTAIGLNLRGTFPKTIKLGGEDIGFVPSQIRVIPNSWKGFGSLGSLGSTKRRKKRK